MLHEYAAVAKRIEDGQDVSTQDANFCSVAVGALLLYSSWQRPGAVEHCTLNEFKARKTEKRQDGTETIVIVVKNHKPALKGPATTYGRYKQLMLWYCPFYMHFVLQRVYWSMRICQTPIRLRPSSRQRSCNPKVCNLQ